jgi:carbon-monoxide dehydrogenase medium subunit
MASVPCPLGRCREARLVYLSVGEGPVVARTAARGLAGEELTPAAIEAAAETAARDDMDPRGDVHATPEFKRHLARVLTRRALRLAAERARSGGHPS